MDGIGVGLTERAYIQKVRVLSLDKTELNNIGSLCHWTFGTVSLIFILIMPENQNGSQIETNSEILD